MWMLKKKKGLKQPSAKGRGRRAGGGFEGSPRHPQVTPAAVSSCPRRPDILAGWGGGWAAHSILSWLQSPGKLRCFLSAPRLFVALLTGPGAREVSLAPSVPCSLSNNGNQDVPSIKPPNCLTILSESQTHSPAWPRAPHEYLGQGWRCRRCSPAAYANSDSSPDEGHHSVTQQTPGEAQNPGEPVLWSQTAPGSIAAHC